MAYDPWDESNLVNPFQQVDPRLTDPSGDSRMFSALRADGSRAAAGRNRSAMLGLKARGVGNPAGYAYAALSAGTQGQSDLAGAVSGARVSSVNRNRDFSEALARNWIEQKQGLSGERRTAAVRAKEREDEYGFWVKQQEYQKRMRDSERKKWYEHLNLGSIAGVAAGFLPVPGAGMVANKLMSKTG